MKRLISKLLPALILITVVFLRFYHLGTIPQGLTKDESYYGYDAYSIIKTGRDIWGQKLPLFFKSTWEYKLNLTYFIIPAIKLFGLKEISLRLPSAVFGLATILILYLTLIKLSFKSNLSLILTLIFAVSPWTFGMSRLFYEGNVGLFFIATGILLIFNQKYSLAGVFLALSAYLYNPYRYIGLGILLSALVIYRHSTSLSKKVKTIVLYTLALLPLILFSHGGSSLNRLQQELILQKTNYELVINEQRANCHLIFNQPLLTKTCYVFWNKAVLYLVHFSQSVIKVISPTSLFLSADSPYFLPPQYGMYLGYLLPFYVLGLTWLFSHRSSSKVKSIKYFISINLAISLLVTSATGNIEFYRYPVSMYFVFLLIAYGLRQTLKFVFNISLKTIRVSILSLLIFIGLFQTGKYLVAYFSYTPTLPLLFASDVREIFDYLEQHRDYNYLVDRIFHGPITGAFLWEIDPAYYQTNVVWSDPDKWGFVNAVRLDNLYSQTYTLEQLLCLKHQNPDKPIKALIIENPTKYDPVASLLTHDFSESLTLHAVYDIDKLYPYVLKNYPNDLCKLDK